MLNYNIGFEINDIETHNITKQDQYYHINKTRMAREQHDIRLIHLWELDNDIILQWILNLLNQNKITLDVNDCAIKHIMVEEGLKFLTDYSLNPYQEFKTCLGIYHNDELIQVLYFNLIDSNLTMNICVKFGYNVITGIDNVLKAFLKTIKMNYITTYVDLSKFTGKTFEELGFKLVDYIKPSIISENLNETSTYRQLYNCGYNVYTLSI